MMPLYQSGDMVIAWKFPFAVYHRNDVVIAKDPRTQKTIMKRITAVSAKGYFLEGENKKESTDSRTYGWVTKSYITAKVIGKLS